MADFSDLPAVGIRTLAGLLDIDRDTVRAALNRSQLTPVSNRGGHPAYAFPDAIRALFSRRGEMDPAMLTPTDRRALADAKLRELELEKRRGELLPREDVRQASATAFALVAAGLRSIPDTLERHCGISPEQAAECERVIDALSGQLADDLEKLHGATAA
nr:DUF1441 family protein [Dechloromonas sp.]